MQFPLTVRLWCLSSCLFLSFDALSGFFSPAGDEAGPFVGLLGYCLVPSVDHFLSRYNFFEQVRSLSLGPPLRTHLFRSRSRSRTSRLFVILSWRRSLFCAAFPFFGFSTSLRLFLSFPREKFSLFPRWLCPSRCPGGSNYLSGRKYLL